jgi:hypothetical protein
LTANKKKALSGRSGRAFAFFTQMHSTIFHTLIRELDLFFRFFRLDNYGLHLNFHFSPNKIKALPVFTWKGILDIVLFSRRALSSQVWVRFFAAFFGGEQI